MAGNWWDSDPVASHPASTPGGILVKGPDPTRRYDLPMAAGRLQAQQQEAELRRLQIKEAEDKAAANATVTVNSNVHGPDYLKTLPPGIVGVVQKVAKGEMAPPQGAALRTPYWQQIIQHVINYDPAFAGYDYGTRAATRKDYATGKMGVNITALNTALGHAGTVQDDASQLGNSTGFLGVNVLNPLRNSYRALTGDPRPGNFQNDVRHFGSEAAKVFVPNGGTAGEREAEFDAVPLNGSPEQQSGILQHDAELFKSRLEAINEQYKRGMGNASDITDLLSPHARSVYSSLLAGGGAVPGGPPSAGGGQNGSGPVVDPSGLNGPNSPGSMGIATGPTKTRYDSQTAGELEQLIRTNASEGEIGNFLKDKGYGAPPAGQISQVRSYLKSHPNYSGFVALGKTEPTSILERVAASPIGSYAGGAANAISAGYTDELGGALSSLAGGDYAQTRDAIDARKKLMAAQNPGADILGNVSGGLLSALGGGAALAKYAPGAAAAVAGALGKAAPVVGDAAYGAAYGSGENNQDRLGGALLGGAVGAGAGAAVRGAGRAIAPTGGSMAPIYAAGGYPTIGQRLADKGFLGRAINTGEQAMQSIPGLGAMVARARQIPRDAFQIGGFNDALSDIGKKLPAGTKPGNAPHAFARDAFNAAYDKARSGMTFAQDSQYAKEFGDFNTQLNSGVLSAEQVKRVNSIITNSVSSRLAKSGGTLAGDAYKQASSEIGKAAQALSRTEPTVANALNDYGAILDGAARRSSPPEASAALDAADRGYAKFVRIQDAAAARGGDSGTFSPTQLDRSVQRNSGGMRSSQYNAGDALMQDYARAGKGLVDTLPNSGSAERLMTGQLVGGGVLGGAGALGAPVAAIAHSPAALAMAPYIPGANYLATRALAPRGNGPIGSVLNRLGPQVYDRSRLATLGLSPALIDALSSQ